MQSTLSYLNSNDTVINILEFSNQLTYSHDSEIVFKETYQIFFIKMTDVFQKFCKTVSQIEILEQTLPYRFIHLKKTDQLKVISSITSIAIASGIITTVSYDTITGGIISSLSLIGGISTSCLIPQLSSKILWEKQVLQEKKRLEEKEVLILQSVSKIIDHSSQFFLNFKRFHEEKSQDSVKELILSFEKLKESYHSELKIFKELKDSFHEFHDYVISPVGTFCLFDAISKDSKGTLQDFWLEINNSIRKDHIFADMEPNEPWESLHLNKPTKEDYHQYQSRIEDLDLLNFEEHLKNIMNQALVNYS